MSDEEKEKFLQEMKVTIIETANKAIEPIRKDINELKLEIIELKEVVIPSMQKEINSISRTVEIIEVEHEKKLDILLDELLKKA